MIPDHVTHCIHFAVVDVARRYDWNHDFVGMGVIEDGVWGLRIVDC